MIRELLVSVLGLEHRENTGPENVEFLQAKNYGPKRTKAITAVVLHATDGPEGPKSADNVAGWFATQPANGSPYPPEWDQRYKPKDGKFHGTSAHYVVGDKKIIQTVNESDEAWHASSANPFSIGIELVGYAKQSAEEWNDDYSRAQLHLAARLTAAICKTYGIPPERLPAEDLKSGKRIGITGHSDVVQGLEGGHGHYDPGAGFPWAQFLTMVRGYLMGGPTSPPSDDSSLLGVLVIGMGVGLATYFVTRS